MNTFNLPIYKWVTYSFNPQTGFFNKTDRQPEKHAVNSLPFELKREITQSLNIKGKAKECLTKREYKKENNSRKILTGLQETAFNNWFSGDHVRIMNGDKLKSLLLVHFSTDNSRLNVFFFSGFFKEFENERLRFANSTIPLLMEKHFI